MIKYFVWEPSPQGPVARIWHGLQTDGNGKQQATVGKTIELHSGEDTLNINYLKERYPHENL